MKKRHRWGPEVDGVRRCSNCGLEVKPSDVKRGGLGPCIPGRWKTNSTVDDNVNPVTHCRVCDTDVPNTIFCLNCAAQLHPLGWRPEA